MRRTAMVMAGAALALCACDRGAAPSGEAAAPAASAAPAAVAAGEASGPLTLTCEGPITAKTTLADLVRLYGAENLTAETFQGPEGITAPATALFASDPARKASVLWADEARTQISSVVVQGPDSGTAWTGPGGLRIGSTLQQVQAANGRPFELYGFDWDYGGRVTDLKGGALEPAGQGCRQQFQLQATAQDYTSAAGDSPFASDDPRMVAARPVVTEIGIGFPVEPG